MSDRIEGHVSQWLAAYQDGELLGARLRQVEEHVAGCASCRAELAELRALSDLLHDAPLPAARTSPARFAAQVALRLSPPGENPRSLSEQRLVHQPRRSWQRVVWQTAPFALLAGWAFIQAATFLVSPLLLLLDAPFTPAQVMELKGWLAGGLSGPLPGISQPLDLGLVGLVPALKVIVLNLFATFACAVMLAAWLAVWWLRRKDRSGE